MAIKSFFQRIQLTHVLAVLALMLAGFGASAQSKLDKLATKEELQSKIDKHDAELKAIDDRLAKIEVLVNLLLQNKILKEVK